jgi:hypothetical protein
MEKSMKYKYYINGFTYGRAYFFSVGSFTEKQVRGMYNGKMVTYNGNEFWIEEVET